MAKPTDLRCNPNWAYCFLLKKERLYPGSPFRMSGEFMESQITFDPTTALWCKERVNFDSLI